MTLQKETELPTGWKWVKLGDVVQAQSGGTPRRGVEKYWGGQIKWAKIKDITQSGKYITDTEETITKEAVSETSTQVFPVDTVLFAMYASIGESSIVKSPIATNQAILGCKCGDNILPEFLWNWFHLTKSNLLRMGRGGTQANLNAGIVRALDIPLPPLEEQERIVGILNRVDEIKSLREDAYNKATELINSIFHDMAGKYTQETDLPAGWKWVKLGDVCDVVGGGTPSRTEKSFWEGRIPWATVKDMTSQNIISTLETISLSGLENSSTTLVKQGTVIIASRVGLGKIGIAGIDVCINQDLKALLPKDENNFNNQFLYYFMESKASEIVHMGVGTTVKGIRVAQIVNIDVSLPPLAEQERIVGRIHKAESIRDAAEESLRKIEELQASMVQKAFRGEI